MGWKKMIEEGWGGVERKRVVVESGCGFGGLAVRVIKDGNGGKWAIQQRVAIVTKDDASNWSWS